MSRTLSMNWGSGDNLKVSTWWGLSPKARQATLGEAASPLAHRSSAAAESGGDVDGVLTVGCGQDDPTAQRQRLRALGATGPSLQRLSFVGGQLERRPSSHRRLHRRR